MPSVLKHPCDSWMCDVPKIQTIVAQPHEAWGPSVFFSIYGISMQESGAFFLAGNVDNKGQHRIARKCVGRSGRCSVSALRFLLFTSPHQPSPFVSRACHGSHLERTTIPEHVLRVEWETIHSTRQTILIWELLTLRLTSRDVCSVEICVGEKAHLQPLTRQPQPQAITQMHELAL